MREAPRVRAVALAMLVLCSIVAGVASPAVASSPADPPSGMVGVSASNVEDLRPADMKTNVTADQLDGAVYVSDHASTTEVSIVTGDQAKAVANGASPSDVAGDAVCSSPAAGKNPVFDCGTNFALVISDNAVDTGRDVAIRTSVLKDALGYVPRQITVANNDTAETWSYVAERQDGWLVASVEHFSSNSVTWSGSVNITSSSASDGSSFSYDVADLDSASNVTVNLTGVNSSEDETRSWTGLEGGETASFDVAGNAEVDATVKFTGLEGLDEGNIPELGVSPLKKANQDAIAWHPNGELLAVATANDEVVIYNTTDWSSQTAITANGYIQDLAWHPDGDYLAVAEQAAGIHVYDSSYNEIGSSPLNWYNTGMAVAWHPNGTYLAAGGDNSNSEGRLKVYDTSDFTTETTFTQDGIYRIEDVAWDPDGDYVVGTSISPSEKLFMYENGTWSEHIDSPKYIAHPDDIAWSSKGGLAIADGADGQIEIYDSNFNRKNRVYGISNVYSVAWHPNGEYLAAGHVSGNITIRDPETLNEIEASPLPHSNSIDGVDWHPKKQYLAGSTPDGAFLYDTDTLETVDPSITIDGQTADYSGTLNGSETHSETLAGVSTGSYNKSFNVTGSADLDINWTETTQTQDPGVELNNGNYANHTGTLADGETVSLTIDESHINEGTNTVNVSVGEGSLSADAPDPVVGLNYSHDAADSQTVDYVGGTWVEQYNVTKTYSSDRQNPTLTVPFNEEMAKLERAKYRTNGGSWQTASYSWTSGTTLVVELPHVQADDKVTVVANGTTISSNGEVKVIEPTPPGQRLDSKIKVTQLPNSGDVYVAVGGTADGDRVHYLYDESWDANEHSIIKADGTNKVYLPNAAADGTARVTTWPLKVEPSSGAVMVDEVKGTRSEPGVLVGPTVDGSTTVQYTFVNAEDGVKYNLYSQRGIVRDSGTANSPLTLEDDDSSETLLFKKENTSSTDDSDDSTDPVQQVGQFAQDQASAFSSFDMLGIVGLGLVGLAGAVVVVRRRRDGDGGSSGSLSATGAIGSIAGRLTSGLEAILGQVVGLLRWFVTNPKMAGALLLLGGIGAVVTGLISLPPGTGILLIAVGVPLLTYFAMRKLDRFNPLVFGTVSVGAMVLGLQLLGGNLVESFLTALGPGALILALAVLYVIYRAIMAYQTAASAPEEVNQINIGDDDNDENN